MQITNRVNNFLVTAAVPSPPVTSLEAMMCLGFSPLTLRLDGFALMEKPEVVAPLIAPANVCWSVSSLIL